jgi:hypothetical protein
MKTFFNILQTLINKKDKLYPDENNLFIFEISNSNNNDFIYVYSLIQSIHDKQQTSNYDTNVYKNASAKMKALNLFLENIFYNDETKDSLFNIFSLAQKHYFSFLKFANIYKLKKSQIVVNTDLMLNVIDQNHKNTFTIVENKKQYLFTLNELISIIENAIGNSPHFFSQPLWPLNPYTNQKLLMSTLYNIYFKMKQSGRVISLLFHYLFLEHFNLVSFSEKHESYIRETAIYKHVFNSPYSYLYEDIIGMLYNNVYTRALPIHEDFPKETLVQIFRPFLYYYYIISYGENDYTKTYKYRIILNKKFQKFCEFNSMFGRKIIKLIKKFGKVIKTEISFNTDHISFYNIYVNTNSLHYIDNFNQLNNNSVNNSVNNSDINSDSDSNSNSDTEHNIDTEHNNDINYINQQLDEINNEYNDDSSEETGSIS